MDQHQVCIDRSYSYDAISDRAAQLAAALKIDVFLRALPTVRIDMADGSHRTEWGMFVDQEAYPAADLYMLHLLSSDADNPWSENDSDAAEAADEARREIEEELWGDSDQLAAGSDSGWIYPDEDL